MAFINESGMVGIIIYGFTNDVTGSLFLTMLIFTLILTLIPLLFRVPVEFSVIFVLPFLLTCMAYMGEFITIGGVILIYLALLMSKMFFFR